MAFRGPKSRLVRGKGEGKVQGKMRTELSVPSDAAGSSWALEERGAV